MLPPSLSWYGAYMFKAFPLDMSQYPYLFGTSRIPHLQRDTIANDRTSKHLLVIRNGHLFSVKVLDDDGKKIFSFFITRLINLFIFCRKYFAAL